MSVKNAKATLKKVLDGTQDFPVSGNPEAAPVAAALRKMLNHLIASPLTNPAHAATFHMRCTVSLHHIRELVSDDDLLTDALRASLPPYDGLELLLYRGENIDRFEAGKIGSGWSDKEETARMFASGLNAMGKGGVLLRTLAPAAAIIASPSDHSANWLCEREFSVDHRRLGIITEVQRFPPSY